MTHPNGEERECVLRTLNICDGSRLKTLLTRPPCECALIYKRLIEEEKWQDQQRCDVDTPGSRDRPDWTGQGLDLLGIRALVDEQDSDRELPEDTP